MKQLWSEICPMAQGGMVKRSNFKKNNNIENCFDIQTTKIQLEKMGKAQSLNGFEK